MTDNLQKRRLALVIEYDGAGYNGSQIQTNAPTIQEELETAIERLTGARPRAAFAGRTDAGVHARGQVAAFNTNSELDPAVFESGLNAWLPEQIAVRRALDVEAGFDPRRHASSRTYRYTIYNSQQRSPLHRGRAWHVAGRLDEEAMHQAGSMLIGTHDFAAFSRDEGVSTMRCVTRCDVTRNADLIAIEMEATAFLRQQVRRTTGALVGVGGGKLALEAFQSLLDAAEAASAGPLAPPHGLCLERVLYQGLDLMDRNTL